MTKGGGVGWGWLQFLWHGRSWEVMGGKATTNVVEMRDSDLDPIYNFDSVFLGATYCSFFFQSTLSCPTFALDTQLSSLLLLFLA